MLAGRVLVSSEPEIVHDDWHWKHKSKISLSVFILKKPPHELLPVTLCSNTALSLVLAMRTYVAVYESSAPNVAAPFRAPKMWTAGRKGSNIIKSTPCKVKVKPCKNIVRSALLTTGEFSWLCLITALNTSEITQFIWTPFFLCNILRTQFVNWYETTGRITVDTVELKIVPPQRENSGVKRRISCVFKSCDEPGRYTSAECSYSRVTFDALSGLLLEDTWEIYIQFNDNMNQLTDANQSSGMGRRDEMTDRKSPVVVHNSITTLLR